MLAGEYQVEVNDDTYAVVDAETTSYWAVIAGMVSDEIFETLTAPGFTVILDRPDLVGKAMANGIYCISGYPSRSFPQLATTAYSVNYTLSAPGYRDLELTANIPVGATFPVAPPVAAMRLLPVRLQGRVVSSTTRAPIGGASIVSIDNPSTPPSVHTIALRSPLYFAHASGAAVREVSITSAGSASLTQNAASGDQILNLSTRSGIVVGDVVSLNYGSGVQLEYGVVASIGPGSAGAAGTVTLTNGLNRSYPAAGTTVAFATVAATGSAATLPNGADEGDGVLLASQLFAQTVGVDLGTPQAEVHEVGALSGTDGYYGLDGVGRVQEIFLEASQGASQQVVSWFVEYDDPFNQVDFQI